MRRSSVVRSLVLGCLLLLGPAALLASYSTRVGVRIEPSRTWVGLAPVHLKVSDLWLTEGSLEGSYDIRVPLMPSKNDSGTISLDLPIPLESLRAEGGKLAGSARSSDDGAMRTITCEVASDGDIVIFVMMPDRTLQFRSRYQTLDPNSTDPS